MEVSDEEISRRVNEILEKADLEEITAKAVIQQLQEESGYDLSGKKSYIRREIEAFLTRDLDDQVGESGAPASEISAAEMVDDDSDEERFLGRIQRAFLSSSSTNKKAKGKGGLTKPCRASKELEAFIGKSQVSRTEVLTILWRYIRDHRLQFRKNRQRFHCDEAMKKVFKVDQLDMFQLQRVLTEHLLPLDEFQYLNAAWRDKEKKVQLENTENLKENALSTHRQEKFFELKRRRREKEIEEKKMRKKVVKARTDYGASLRLSPELREFLGTSEIRMTRQEVIKQMWVYIERLELEDPSDNKTIVCDDKLQKLFGCESFSGFGMSKLLKDHFVG